MQVTPYDRKRKHIKNHNNSDNNKMLFVKYNNRCKRIPVSIVLNDFSFHNFWFSVDIAAAVSLQPIEDSINEKDITLDSGLDPPISAAVGDNSIFCIKMLQCHNVLL